MKKNNTQHRPLITGARNTYRFHVMIKPIGALCNLDCTYCYYLHKTQLLRDTKNTENSACDISHAPRMDDALLERFIKQYIESNEHDQVVFSWQGGEPTLLGIPFFEKVVRLQEKYTPKEKNVANTLQTNGTLLTDAWGVFLKEHRFLVGLSVDGPEKLHDMYRHNKAGNGSFAHVMRGHSILCKHNVPFTTLTTVNRHNAQKPLEVYNFLTQELGSPYVQFNPCVEPKDFTATAPHYWQAQHLPTLKDITDNHKETDAFVTPWSVRPHDWGVFLCSIFDTWVQRDLGKVLVNWFETAVAQTMRLPAQICTTGNICGKGVALEHDGSVYSCDHYVNREYYLGNIRKKHLKDIVFSAPQQAFAFKKQETLAQECLQCPHGTLCWGQCPRHRFVKVHEKQHPQNYLCAGFKAFYKHATPTIRAIAQSCLSARQNTVSK